MGDREETAFVAAMEELEESLAHLYTAAGHFITAKVPLAGSDALMVAEKVSELLDTCQEVYFDAS